ncbi:MAG TPA: hypothetical protein VKU82_14500 [Planctomycetaceae bacterium]|nr:hypothetical protein [Planctomycetaceae bacterium]
MIEVEKAADRIMLRGAEIEIAFQYAGDRWQHFVSVRCEGKWLVLMESEEGLPSDEAPPSPALQDLRFEQIADDIFEFQLLGQAGKGFYSAAVRFDGTRRTINFDVCARGRSGDAPLCTASRYILADRGCFPSVRQHETALVLLPNGAGPIEFAPAGVPGGRLVECRIMDEQTKRRIAAGCFEPFPSQPGRKPASVRWMYRVTCVREP